jgi:6-phosphogluconate dehydrogenase
VDRKIGVIGLGVMGANLALNIERNGFSVAVYNRSFERTEALVNGPAAARDVLGAQSVEELVCSLERPRRVLLMVKAGLAVDAVLAQLTPLLEEGDVIVDGGNSHFSDTDRRIKEVARRGLHFLGMGVSGGEEGALHGPSLMPGGEHAAYELLEPLLTEVAARTESGPCVTWVGQGSAGHFVKMVHNGIEYGDMQLIAEVYDLLRHGVGLEPRELREVFEDWNRSELRSYLIEITAKIVNHPDDLAGGEEPLIEKILDRAGQKGTGKWTTAAALDLGVPVPTITAAVDARLVSALKEERVRASRLYQPPMIGFAEQRRETVQRARAALYAAKICSYAQGFALLSTASRVLDYQIEPESVARIWKAGCIIRADFLDEIRRAFEDNESLPNLLLDEVFREQVAQRVAAWRSVVSLGMELGRPMPALSASLAYFDAYRSERLPANLIQAQRDFFGAHTYERVDREGTFHTDWS